MTPLPLPKSSDLDVQSFSELTEIQLKRQRRAAPPGQSAYCRHLDRWWSGRHRFLCTPLPEEVLLRAVCFTWLCVWRVSHLLVALLTVVSVGPFQQVPFNVLLHGVQKVLVISDVNVEGCEGLLALIPSKKAHRERTKPTVNILKCARFQLKCIQGGALLTYAGIPDRSSGRRRSLPAPC